MQTFNVQKGKRLETKGWYLLIEKTYEVGKTKPVNFLKMRWSIVDKEELQRIYNSGDFRLEGYIEDVI